MTARSATTESVEGVVLRKHPYSESSLIVTVLSADAGQMRFMVRGALRLGRRHFPDLDLLRLVRVQYRESTRTELQTASGVETLRSFPGLTAATRRYQGATWLAQLALGNTVEHAPATQLVQALLAGLARLEQWPAERPLDGLAITLAVAFVALAEHGVLPELAAGSAAAQAQERMLLAGLDESHPLPTYDLPQWLALGQWVAGQMQRAGMVFPPHWARLAGEAVHG
jgi:DNA repair protein RecO